jgi:hypothetical protein
MLKDISNIGEEVYKTWSDEQRRMEIGHLVQGYRNGLPVQILCQLATSIAGSSQLACGHLSAFLPLEERKAMVDKESGTNQQLRALLQSTLL